MRRHRRHRLVVSRVSGRSRQDQDAKCECHRRRRLLRFSGIVFVFVVLVVVVARGEGNTRQSRRRGIVPRSRRDRGEAVSRIRRVLRFVRCDEVRAPPVPPPTTTAARRRRRRRRRRRHLLGRRDHRECDGGEAVPGRAPRVDCRRRTIGNALLGDRVPPRPYQDADTVAAARLPGVRAGHGPRRVGRRPTARMAGAVPRVRDNDDEGVPGERYHLPDVRDDVGGAGTHAVIFDVMMIFGYAVRTNTNTYY